jgi:hypothetical protein
MQRNNVSVDYVSLKTETILGTSDASLNTLRQIGGGFVGKALDGPLKGMNDVLSEAIKGGAKGLTAGFTHGVGVGMRNHYSLKDDFKLGVSEGIMGGAIGFGAGAIEGAFKGGEAAEKLSNRMKDAVFHQGLFNFAKLISSGEISWGQILSNAFEENNFSGKIYGALGENSGDKSLGDKNTALDDLNRLLWGGHTF